MAEIERLRQQETIEQTRAREAAHPVEPIRPPTPRQQATMLDEENAGLRHELAAAQRMIEEQEAHIRAQEQTDVRQEIKEEEPSDDGDSSDDEAEEAPRAGRGRGQGPAPKERRPNEFNGDEDAYYEWKVQMMNYLRTAKNDQEAIRVLVSYLVGPKMVNFVQRVGALYCSKRGRWRCTIDQFWEELDTSFSDLLSMERAHIELLNFH